MCSPIGSGARQSVRDIFRVTRLRVMIDFGKRVFRKSASQDVFYKIPFLLNVAGAAERIAAAVFGQEHAQPAISVPVLRAGGVHGL